jgi:hypothetical protein
VRTSGKKAAFEPPFSIQKKQGATGITTVAPYIAGQWGRGNNRLPEQFASPLTRSRVG